MISDVYFPRVNGVSTSIQTFRQHLQGQGHQVSLIAPDYPQQPCDDDETIIRIASRYVPLDPEDRMLKYGNVLKLTEELRQQAFDVIHIQTPFVAYYAGIELAKRLGIPRVITYHTFFEEYLYNYIPFLPKSWLRLAARRFSASQCNNVDAMIVPSTPIEQRLRDYGVTTEMMKLPTGLDLRAFTKGDGERFRIKHGIAPDRPTLLYVGRVAHEKNIGFLLQMLTEVRQSIPEVLLIIAGEGPALNSLQRLSNKLGLAENLFFIGYLDRNEALLDCYRAADAFVFASRTETQGLVLLEAMALGVPVVSTAILGTADILKQGCGALIAQDNLEDFAEQVIDILNNPQLRERLGCQAQVYVKQWSASGCAEELVKFYQRVITQRCTATHPAATPNTV